MCGHIEEVHPTRVWKGSPQSVPVDQEGVDTFLETLLYNEIQNSESFGFPVKICIQPKKPEVRR